MKRKTLSIILLLLAIVLGVNAQTELWSGSSTIAWSGESISAAKLTTAEVGDKIVITFSINGTVPASSWPQVSLRDGSWNSMPGCGNIQLGDGTNLYTITECTYYITPAMLSKIQSSGLVVTGNGYDLKGVSLVKGAGSAGYENAVWIGDTDATSTWVGQSIPASTFADATVGQYLRLYYSDLKAGAQHTIIDGDWKEISGYGFHPMSGIYYQYTIDETLLNTMKAKGIIINGTGYRLTHVDIVNPEAITTLTASVPVTDGWLYENTDPVIKINITNPETSAKTTEVKLIVKTDKLVEYKTVSTTAEIPSGESKQVSVSFTAEPGFYNVTPLVGGEPVYTASAISSGEKVSSFIIGVDPEKIVSAPDMQSDFDEFWTETKSELAKVDPEYTLTEITAKSSTKRKVYLLEFKSLPDKDGNEAIARAYYAEPVDAGKYPVIIHYQGYDSGDYDPWCMNGNDNPGYIELILATRGQLINNRSPYTNTYGDWFQYGFGDKETYYYRGAFMDAIRAIDFVYSREQTDPTRIYAEGASQGGALTYAAAALTDHPFAAIAPSIPFLGDYPDYFEVASWPAYPAHQQQKALGMSDEDMFKFLSYFDTKNLATKITCPVIETIGLQDNVCPPHTNIAPYNNLPSSVVKEISYNPLLMHTTPSSWYNTYLAFFNKYTSTTGIDAVSTSTDADTAVYDLQGRRLSSAPANGLYIKGNKKYVPTR